MKTKSENLRLISNQPSLFLSEGDKTPLGATLNGQGCNFSVYIDDAKQVELCLFDDKNQEVMRYVLPGKQGNYHFGYLKGVKKGQRYGYRVKGSYLPEQGIRFDHRKLLIDPYAKALSQVQHWDSESYQDNSADMVAKSVVVDRSFDWQGVKKPAVKEEQMLLYELHVKGYTQLNPQVPEPLRGRYLGLTSEPVIAHLKSLGVTSLQLLPITAFMSEPRLGGLGLSNYWGYNPVAFMAPEPRYAQEDAVTEFKTMVRELHRHGFEVILDVVYNHTAEAGHDGPILSLRGLANRNYYLFDSVGGQTNFQSYANNSGCGNSVNLDDPVTLGLVIDSLRYWVEDMQVDGFRFDLAASLAREGNSFKRNAAFFKILKQDPVLSQVKLIAEPWDIGPDGYQLGSFPENWHECNDRFRDTMRGFWRGDAGLLGEFATRVMGSRDIFPANWRSIHSSVNYICYHDGFTLEDLVSYEQRHNQANCENNRDGHGHNLSFNHGEEGASLNPGVLAMRNRQKRNLMACLILSQGIPHILAGDEIGRTQLGNNNAYCQDNSISWVNWQITYRDRQLFDFVRSVIAIRQSSAIFSGLQLEHDRFANSGDGPVHTVRWFRPDGKVMHQEDWHQQTNQAIMVELTGANGCDEAWLLLFNASPYRLQYKLPEPDVGHNWYTVVDTQLDLPLLKHRKVQANRTLLNSRSLQLLKLIRS